MKKYALFILVVIVITGCGPRHYPAGRISQPGGNFSFVTPDGWFRTKLAGLDYLVVSGPADHGMQPNIYVEGMVDSTNTTAVAAGLVARYTSNHPAYTVSTRTMFTTISGMTGIKIVAHRQTREALPITLFQYVIRDRERVIQVTCSCAGPTEAKFEPVFDDAMRSMK